MPTAPSIPKITAAICTLNRLNYLKKAVASLRRQSLPSDLFEVIVVDNGSTDGTRAYCEVELAGLKNFRYVVESRRGLSNARNTALRDAVSPFVAFLDDDAIAGEEWLATALAAFERSDHPACVGGPVAPIWEAPRPPWLSDELLPFLAIVHWGDNPTFLRCDQFLVGANIAFRKEPLLAMGGFPDFLGRKGGNLLSGEEIYVTRKLHRAGLPSFYQPLMSVSHHVSTSRLTQEWFVKRNYAQGLSSAVLAIHIEEPTVTSKLVNSCRVIWKWIRSPGQVSVLFLPLKSSPKWFQHRFAVAGRMGYLKGLWCEK